MDIETIKERDMTLLSRKRVSMMLTNDGATPSRLEILKAVSKKCHTPEDLCVIKHMYPQFGNKKTKIIVNIYQDKAKMEMFEHKNLLIKHRPKVAEAKTE
jgi:ribosomal protein S24E